MSENEYVPTTDDWPTPTTDEVAVAYRLAELLNPDPNSQPHDPEAMALVDAAFRRWLTGHEAEVLAQKVREDCWACATENARKEFRETGRRRVSFLMYTCPACGNKRCAKASDHLNDCDKGAGEQELRKMRDGIQAKRDAEVARAAEVKALREAADDPALRLSGHSGISISRLRALATRIESGADEGGAE